MKKITPFLWFDKDAEAAANFYVSIFKDSKIIDVSRYGDEGRDVHGQPSGQVMTISFELAGQAFTALNGGPAFKFNEAVSFQIHCKDQAEVDYHWERLTADGGEESQCGWLKDKFGVSWQVVPDALPEILGGDDREGANRAMAAMLKMKKLDIAVLRAAYAGK